DRGISGRAGAVVLDQWRRTEITQAQRAEPALGTMYRQAQIDDVRGTVGNEPTPALRLVVEAGACERGVQVQGQPAVDCIAIAQLDPRSGGRSACLRGTSIAVKYELRAQLELENVQRAFPACQQLRSQPELGADGTGQWSDGRNVRILAAARHAARVVAV